MTTMVVLYARSTGLAVGALVSTANATLPTLTGLSTLRIPVRPRNAGTPSPSITAVFRGDDLAVASFDAEFSDPLEVFDWRVASTQTTDGRTQRRLERAAGSGVEAKRPDPTKPKLVEVKVIQLGTVQRLNVEVRTTVESVDAGLTKEYADVKEAIFTTGTTTATVQFPDVPVVPVLVIVEGFQPAIAPKA